MVVDRKKQVSPGTLIMQTNDNILDLIRQQAADAHRAAQRALILQPGAIGDCVLTIQLSKFIKDALGLGGVDMLGHTDYISVFPGRTCIDGILSVDSIDLHRLFVKTKDFNLAEGDSLIPFFAGYSWIITFLGHQNNDFEQNLIFTVNCSQSAEVMTLSLEPPRKYTKHISEYYVEAFIEQCSLSLEARQFRTDEVLIKPTQYDVKRGRELLNEAGISSSENLVILHPGSGGSHKCWHLDNFLAVAEKLIPAGFQVVFLLGPVELERFAPAKIEDMTKITKCITDLSLTEVFPLLSCTGAFVGNDSGITHLAAGLGVKTLAVFGPTDPVVYKPIGPAVTVFTDSSDTFADKPSVALQVELLKNLTEISPINQ